MEFLTRIIDEGDVCSLLFVVAILCGVGQRMVQGEAKLQMWGLRIAAVGFVAFVIFRLVVSGEPTTADLVDAVWKGLLGSALILGPSWIALSIFGFLHGYYQRASSRSRLAADERRRLREERRHSQQQERDRAEWERQTPAREAAAREAEARRRASDQVKATSAQRREDARVACEVLYNLRAPEIGQRFTREQLNEFMGKYMGEDKAVEVVERRAGELQQLIQQHYEAVIPPDKFNSLPELTQWYEEQQKLIGDLPSSDLYKDHFLVRLNERYSELTERLMEKL